MQVEKYVGVPFKAGGRDFSGADCWGIARLFYSNELGIALPSFSAEYTETDSARMSELIAQYREGWEYTGSPEYGDLVLLRVLGTESHIGVYLGNNQFLHAMEKPGSSIQRTDSIEWKSRIVGYFKYRAKTTGVQLNAVPHPLRTEKYSASIPEGTTLLELSKWVIQQYDISPELDQRVLIFVNGVQVLEKDWPLVILKDSDAVEYRSVPGKDALRIVLFIALAFVAPQIALLAGPVGSLAYTATLLAVNVVGGLLINAIAPIRPPKPPEDPGQARGQLLINGGQNAPAKYGAIPVVLGKVRLTAPLAANTYSNTGTDVANLKMLLCWGFGPLSIQDIRIGGTGIDQYIHTKDTVNGSAEETATDYANLYNIYSDGKDVEQVYRGVALASDGTEGTSIWVTQSLTQTSTSLSVTLHFPQGLRQVQTKNEGAGNVYSAFFRGMIEYRRLNASTGVPEGAWVNPRQSITLPTAWSTTLPSSRFSVVNPQSAWFDNQNGPSYTYYNFFQWHMIGIDAGGRIVVVSGTPSQSQTQEPNANTISVLNSSNYGYPSGTQLLKPPLPANVLPLVNVCTRTVQDVYSDDSYFDSTVIVAEEITRITGSEYSYTGLAYSKPGAVGGYSTYISQDSRITISAGNVTVLQAGALAINLGGPGEPFNRRKDAFSYTMGPWNVPEGRYEIRVRRTNSDEENPGGNDAYQNFHAAVLHTVTGYANRNPVVNPRNCKLALTAIDIRATDQINNSIEGINALLTTIALDYTGTTSTNGIWALRETNNPASLFRYILEHPANAQRTTNTVADLNLPELQEWHVYCQQKNFTFNDVISEQRSILEILRDICAAGRASPVLRDGKWTVVIDKQRSSVVQHFTPHNSWGFESVKTLPKQLDAFRVRYIDENLNYQENEVIVYNEGKNDANAELYEELQLPGVTNAGGVFMHARWNLAQLKLRPETYTLTTDMEYLVCQRGDLVRVGHGVPLWGTATGRILSKVDNNTIILDQEVPLETGKTYTIRIRTAAGVSVTKTLLPVTDGYYTEITFSSIITDLEAEEGNLFMLGELDVETQQLVVISIEPLSNGNARITLVDYSPEIYAVDTSDTYDLPDFDTNITLPARNLQTSITMVPVFTSILSDESVLTTLSPGNFAVNLVATIAPESGVSSTFAGIEAQAMLVDDTSDVWDYRTTALSPATSLRFTDVLEGGEYKIRARYLSNDGRTGPWSQEYTHTVIGKTTPPATPTGFNLTVLAADGLLQFAWTGNSEPDIAGYELREADTGWGNPSYLWRGGTTQADVPAPLADVTRTYYLRSYDYSRNYSLTSAQIGFTTPRPGTITGVSYVFGTTSNTNSTVTLSWTAPINQLIQLSQYRLTIQKPSLPTVIEYVTGSTYTMPADWIGNATVDIVTIDSVNNESTAFTLPIPKEVPLPVTNPRVEIVDNNVFLRWEYSAVTSLPISHALVKRGATWESPDRVVGEKDGTFTSIFELTGGAYVYWIAAVDTDGRESTPISIGANVSQPPDFVFNGEFTSTLIPGTKVNTAPITNSTSLLMLVDTTETWTGHFTTNAWASPNAQVVAGYPIYAQPGVATASYQETFAIGTTLSSSSISVNYSGFNVSGSPTVYATIETRLGAGAWSTPAVGTSLFTTNFSEIRVTIIANRNVVGNLYRLDSLSVRLDSKQVADGGSISALSTDTLGTIVNFNREFIDVTSITLTPASTTPVYAAYDFLDEVKAGTYTVTSNVATLAVTAHGLLVGQRVRLNFSTGLGISGVYTVLSITTNSYTVAMTVANTSGAVSTYPESLRVYAFNNAGTRVSCPVSWSARGY